jgi:transcriptional regulator with XRE-family HTH domain
LPEILEIGGFSGVHSPAWWFTLENEMANAEIGQRVQMLRTRAALSLDQLAERAGMSKSYLSRLESGGVTNPRLFDLIKTARALNVPILDLLPPDAGGTESIIDDLQNDPELVTLFSNIGRGTKQKQLTPRERRVLLHQLQTIVDTLYADDE